MPLGGRLLLAQATENGRRTGRRTKTACGCAVPSSSHDTVQSQTQNPKELTEQERMTDGVPRSFKNIGPIKTMRYI